MYSIAKTKNYGKPLNIYILKDDFEMIYYIQLKKQGKKETTENE